jgi:hypothetical protein
MSQESQPYHAAQTECVSYALQDKFPISQQSIHKYFPTYTARQSPRYMIVTLYYVTPRHVTWRNVTKKF